MAAVERRLGPLVHRAVHHASALWLAGSLLFIVAMVVTQVGWSGPPAYSLSRNSISDLGNTGCGPFPGSTSPGSVLRGTTSSTAPRSSLGSSSRSGRSSVRTGFPSRRSSTIGLGLVMLAGAGAVGVGLFPENVHTAIHGVATEVAFLPGSLALIVLGFAMFRDTRWDGLRAYTLFSGLLGLVATALFSFGDDLGLGPGGMERLIVAPLLLWLIIAPLHLLRIPQYAPHAVPSAR